MSQKAQYLFPCSVDWLLVGYVNTCHQVLQQAANRGLYIPLFYLVFLGKLSRGCKDLKPSAIWDLSTGM